MEDGVAVTVENLSFSIQSKTLAQRCLPCFFPPTLVEGERLNASNLHPEVPPGRIRLLQDINFVAPAGRLTALMGPSGCGKTTLLNVISDRAYGQRDRGTVRFKGVEGRKRQLSHILSMVYSSDKMFPYLTVTETLMFAAFLRLGDTTQAKRREKVNTIMRELALTHVADTPIGGVWKKGLSTGEMRRLSIAQELITEPAILLLDEPTSGLDAVLAYEVIFVLRQVARRGRTVVCSIHQPRSSIYELFDNLVLLGQGRQLYAGPADKAVRWFGNALRITPEDHESASEFLIDLASENTREKRQFLTLDPERTEPATEDLKKTSVASKDGLSCASLAELFARSNENDRISAECEEMRTAANVKVFKSRVRNAFVQWWLELYAVAYRSFRNSYRNPLTFLVVFGVQIFVGLFLGAIFFRLPQQYLPDVEPVYIADENSAMMKAFETTTARFLTTGIDGQGYNPLFEMLLEGVDNEGSMPFESFAESFISGPFAEMPECTWKVLELGEKEKYAYANLTEYTELWSKDNENDLTAPDYVMSIIRGLQVLDYVVGDIPWTQIMEHAWATTTNAFRPFYLWPECVSISDEVLDAMAVCSGVYPRPPSPLSPLLLQTCAGSTVLVTTMRTYRYLWRENIANANTEWPGPEGKRERLIDYSQAYTISPQSRSLDEKQSNKLKRRDYSAAADRKLQAASLIGGGLGSFTSFLPSVAMQMFDKIGSYAEVLTTCDHPFCAALSNMLNADGAIDGSSIGDYGSALGAILNIAGALFFSVANVGFASYDALVSFSQERVIFNREVANKMYKPSSYFLGKSLSDLLFQFMPALGLVTCFFFLVNLEAGPHGQYFWSYAGICLIVSYTSYGFAYMLSAVCKTMEIALVSAPLVQVIFLCCSGFFVRDSAVPNWMVWVKYLSLYRWGFFALNLNQFPPGGSYWGLPNSFSLALAGITETRLWVCLVWLLGLGTAFRILAFMALRWTNRRAGIEQ